MLILAIFAPFVLLVALFIIGSFFAAAYERNDKTMMKFWGVVLGIILVLLTGGFWIYHQIDLNF